MTFNGVYFHAFSRKLDNWELPSLFDMLSILSRFLFDYNRKNSGNLYEMKKAVGAILWHCTDMKDIGVRHQFGPKIQFS